MSYIDDLSDSDEDEFPPGYLAAYLKEEEDVSDGEENEVYEEVAAPRRLDGPPVEFKAVTYKERQFAKKMRLRVDARIYHRPPSLPAGPPRSAFANLGFCIDTTTTVIDLAGQVLTDDALASLWTLMGESPVLRRVSLRRTGFWSGHAAALRDALLRNPGTLEELDLMGNALDDAGLKVLFDFDPWRTLCRGKLRLLNLRSNHLSAEAGPLLASMALPPSLPPAETELDDELSVGSCSTDATKEGQLSLLQRAERVMTTAVGGSNVSVVSAASSSSSTTTTNSSGAADASHATAKAARFDELSGVPVEVLLKAPPISEIATSTATKSTTTATKTAGDKTANGQGGGDGGAPLRALNLRSCGLGAAEASMLGELLSQHGAGIGLTSVDLSWNSAVGCDGVTALAKALQQSSSPSSAGGCCPLLESLDLSGTRCCDVDEKGDPFLVHQASYGGSALREPGSLLKRREPVLVLSRFRSQGVAELALLVRTARVTPTTRNTQRAAATKKRGSSSNGAVNAAAGPGFALKRLALNDCCLCLKYDERSSQADNPRPLEWCRPPDPFDRCFLSENQSVRACALLPGVGSLRLKREWHEGRVADLKASKKGSQGGSLTVSVGWAEERLEKQTMLSAQRVFNAKAALQAQALKAKQAAAKAAGVVLPKPPRGMVASRPKPARLDADDGQVLTLQPCAAVAALAEMLRHGVPPPPTPDELLVAKQDAEARAKKGREEAEAKAAEEKGALEKAGKKKKPKTRNLGGNEESESSSSASQSSSSDSLLSRKEGAASKRKDGDDGDPDLLRVDSMAASSWHLTEGSSSVVSAGSFSLQSAGELALFEAEAEAVLESYLSKQQPQGGERDDADDDDDDDISALGRENDLEEEGASLLSLEELLTEADDDDDSENDGGDGDSGQGVGEDAGTKAQGKAQGKQGGSGAASSTWGAVPLPEWAAPSGGRFGGMAVVLDTLELQRCSLDSLGLETLCRGLQHPACPLSSLHLDGNTFGHGDNGGGLALVAALDANKSLTFLSATGCALSALVRREWSGALNGNSRGRVGSIALDAVLVPPPPRPSTLALRSTVSPTATSTATSTAARIGSEEVGRRLGGGGGGTKNAATSGVRLKLAQAVDAAATAPSSSSSSSSAMPPPPDPQVVRSNQVKVSDALLLASALAKNRFVTCLDLQQGCVLDEEALQILMDALHVRSRLPPPPLTRPVDEDYRLGAADNDNDRDGRGVGVEEREEGETRIRGGATTTELSSNTLSLSIPASPLPPSSPFFSSPTRSQLSLLSPPISSLRKRETSPSSSSSSTPLLNTSSPAPPPPPLLPPPSSGVLLSLSLAGVYLGSEGASVVADSLRDLRWLRHLSLARCELTDRGKRVDPARMLVRALEDEPPPPPPPPPLFFGDSSNSAENQKSRSEGNGSTGGGRGGGGEATSTGVDRGSGSDVGGGGGGRATVGKSPSFWKFQVVPAPPGPRPGPPLEFLDLSDNGLPCSLVWRAAQVMRRRHAQLKWLDLSGNMAHDATDPPLAVEPSQWACHNFSPQPQQLQLTLPMRHAILFLGLGVDWVVETDNPITNSLADGKPQKNDAGGGGADDATATTATSRQTAFTGKGSQGSIARSLVAGKLGSRQQTKATGIAALEARANAHGAPLSFTPTGVQGVALRVERVARAHPELFQHASSELKACVMREGRLGTIDSQLATAEKRLALLVAKHVAVDRLEVLTELKAAEDFARVSLAEEKLLARTREGDERKHMRSAELSTKQLLQLKADGVVRESQRRADLACALKETPSMEECDYDAGDYQHEVGVVGEGPKERAHVRRCFHSLAECRAGSDLGWEALPALFQKCGLGAGMDQARCEAIASIEYDPAYGRRPDRVKVSDARHLYAVAKLAAVFDQVDEDGSGEIQEDELEGAMGTLGFDMPASRCQELLRTIDTNNDGSVDLKEFVTFFKFIPMDVRMKAEATAAASKKGIEGVLNLKKKLGMVVNPDGAVARVTEGGQAESMGLRNGCRLVECGGVPISSLAEIKTAIAACKVRGDATLVIRFRDPRKAAQAAAELARLKADSSAMARQQAREASSLQEAKAAEVEADRLALVELNFELRRRAKAETAKRHAEMDAAREATRLESLAKKAAFEELIRLRRQEELDARGRGVARAKAEEERAVAVLAEQERRVEVEQEATEEVARLAMERCELMVEAGLMSEADAEAAAMKVLADLSKHSGEGKPPSEAAKAARAARDAAQAAAEKANGTTGGGAKLKTAKSSSGASSSLSLASGGGGADGQRPTRSPSGGRPRKGGQARSKGSGRRLRFVLSAVEERVDPKLFQFAFALVSIHDCKRAAPLATNTASSRRKAAAASQQATAATAAATAEDREEEAFDAAAVRRDGEHARGEGDDSTYGGGGGRGDDQEEEEEEEEDGEGADHHLQGGARGGRGSRRQTSDRHSPALRSPHHNRSAEIRTMTCELRCLRMWAKAMAAPNKNRNHGGGGGGGGCGKGGHSSPSRPRATRYANPNAASHDSESVDALAASGSGNLFQDVRSCLMHQLQRGDVATWFRSLLLRTQPLKPLVGLEHEDGSYLVFDDLLGWIQRLETKAAPCACLGCQDHTPAFPLKSPHFTLPDLSTAPLTKTIRTR